MRVAASVAVLAGALVTAPSFAQGDDAGAKLAQQKNCLDCHSVDKKRVGPSYKEVALRHAGKKSAVEQLVTKIMKRGSGVWDAVPMPAPAASDAEAHRLAQWVLNQK